MFNKLLLHNNNVRAFSTFLQNPPSLKMIRHILLINSVHLYQLLMSIINFHCISNIIRSRSVATLNNMCQAITYRSLSGRFSISLIGYQIKVVCYRIFHTIICSKCICYGSHSLSIITFFGLGSKYPATVFSSFYPRLSCLYAEIGIGILHYCSCTIPRLMTSLNNTGP